MAVEYEIEVNSLESIYLNNNGSNKHNRKLKVFFSVPEAELNEETGIMIYTSGFGGDANSNVAKKMRKTFPDKYNLVVVQCNYFGYEFMQNNDSVYIPNLDEIKELTQSNVDKIYESGEFNINTFLKICTYKGININLKADLKKENLNNLNDMGIMQAIDIIVALLSVMNILYSNNFTFNAKKIIAYGNSHGSYLNYLANILAPGLFSLIIDNSAWIFPRYFEEDNDRIAITMVEGIVVTIKYSYLVKKLNFDKQIYDLNYLYTKYKNDCKVICYHGIDDELISNDDKFEFCGKIDNCLYNEINNEKIDGKIFKSTMHGVGADFLELFDLTMRNLDFKFDKNANFDLIREVRIETDSNTYIIDYDDMLPKIYIK